MGTARAVAWYPLGILMWFGGTAIADFAWWFRTRPAFGVEAPWLWIHLAGSSVACLVLSRSRHPAPLSLFAAAAVGGIALWYWSLRAGTEHLPWRAILIGVSGAAVVFCAGRSLGARATPRPSKLRRNMHVASVAALASAGLFALMDEPGSLWSVSYLMVPLLIGGLAQLAAPNRALGACGVGAAAIAFSIVDLVATAGVADVEMLASFAGFAVVCLGLGMLGASAAWSWFDRVDETEKLVVPPATARETV